MLEDEGHWIKLMRTATLPTDANICLRFSGKDIVCTVTKDVNKEVELKVTCSIADPGHEEGPSPEPPPLSEEKVEKSLTETNDPVPKVPSTFESDSASSTDEMLDLVAGNVMSSSKSPQDLSVERSRSEQRVMEDAGADEIRSTAQLSPSRDHLCKKRENSRLEDEAHDSKSIKTSEEEQLRYLMKEEGISYRCPGCEYISHEYNSFQRHLQSHKTSANSSMSSRNTPPQGSIAPAMCHESSINPRSFCNACKIQFMSVNTYMVHKKYYCKSRHDRETENVQSTSPAQLDYTIPSTAFRPGSDTVILRGLNNSANAQPPLIQPQAIYAAISTNPLVLLPCTLVGGQGLVVSQIPQALPSGNPGIVLQAVSEKSKNTLKEDVVPARKTSHPTMPSVDLDIKASMPSLKRKMSEGDVLNLKKTCTSEDLHAPVPMETTQQDNDSSFSEQDNPLDLSIKKKLVERDSNCPPRRRRSSSTCRPSSPLLINRSSPGQSVIKTLHGTVSPIGSHSNDATPCYTSVVVPRVPVENNERLSPLPPVLHVAVGAEKLIPGQSMVPPKLIKQGNNICEECNIVFYKYDNFLAHKKHYCAYRRRQLSALAAAAAAAAEQSSDDNNSNHSNANDACQSNYTNDDPLKVGALSRSDYGVAENYRPPVKSHQSSVYCCDACGVKFSTSDNLNAHQTYYCNKTASSAMFKAAQKGDGSSSPGSPFCGPEEWKCNYCEATCSSYETIRRHLLTHSELRGFRCLICGYKGNTLRGMRTHACEHLVPDDSIPIDEFVNSTVITERDIPILSRATDCSDEDSSSPCRNTAMEIRPTSHQERSHTELMTKDATLMQTEKITENSHNKVSDIENFHSSLKNSSCINVGAKSGDNVKQEAADDASRCHVPETKSPLKPDTDSEDLTDSSLGDSSNTHLQDSVPMRASCIKTESSSLDSHQGVNPLSFCDVVIKTESENLESTDDCSRDAKSDYDSDDRPRDLSMSPPDRSVIRVVSGTDHVKDESQQHSSSKRRDRSQNKTELKYCKSCDISFYHLSNFLAHKKFYCVSRVIRNCLPETTVQ